jgi:hypothetical protein
MTAFGGSPAFPEIEQQKVETTYSYEGLFYKVKEMRRLQKCYFRFHRESDLMASKTLEKEVDLIIDDLSLPTLFK